MTRLILALLVLLGVWLPSTAAALSRGAPEAEMAEISALSADYEAVAVRGLAAVEIVTGSGSSGCTGRKTPPSHVAPALRPHAGGQISRPTSLQREARTDVVLPHGEHLPYFPTAPPSDR